MSEVSKPHSEQVEDMTYFGGRHSFTVSGEADELSKLATCITDLKRERDGLLEQYGTLHAAALALLESADDQTHPDDGFPIEEWLNLVDAVRGSNPAKRFDDG